MASYLAYLNFINLMVRTSYRPTVNERANPFDELHNEFWKHFHLT